MAHNRQYYKLETYLKSLLLCLPEPAKQTKELECKHCIYLPHCNLLQVVEVYVIKILRLKIRLRIDNVGGMAQNRQ